MNSTDVIAATTQEHSFLKYPTRHWLVIFIGIHPTIRCCKIPTRKQWRKHWVEKQSVYPGNENIPFQFPEQTDTGLAGFITLYKAVVRGWKRAHSHSALFLISHKSLSVTVIAPIYTRRPPLSHPSALCWAVNHSPPLNGGRLLPVHPHTCPTHAMNSLLLILIPGDRH